MSGNSNDVKQRIMGGGRAMLSDSTKQAVVRLLMDIRHGTTRSMSMDSDEATTMTTTTKSSSSSNHAQQREERRFTKNLVQEFERERLERRFNLSSNADPASVDTGSSDVKSTPASTENKAKTATINPKNNGTDNTGGKVRIEFIEALPTKDDKVSKDKSKNKKDNKKKTSKSHDLGFREGNRKIAVMDRSISTTEICKQVQSKLKMKKKPVRVFIVLSKNETATGKPTIVDLDTDLSGVDDGTKVFISSTPSMTHSPIENESSKGGQRNQSTESPDESSGVDAPLVDPLDQAKQAYKQQDRQQMLTNRRQRRRNGRNNTEHYAFHPPSKEITEARARLPAAACKDEILTTIRSNPCVVLCGQTGSGKSTQVPQFILDGHPEQPHDLMNEMSHLKINESSSSSSSAAAAAAVSSNTDAKDHELAKPSSSNRSYKRPYIVVTQPRRVAAISLAQRVSEEVGGGSPGSSGSRVGYIVRLDRKIADESCRIIYCTIGVLLRMLVCPKDSNDSTKQLENSGEDDDERNYLPPLSIDTISHLILDEVHERDVQTDFCLTLLKGLLPSRPDLRLILMSATASADTFVNFFAPVVSRMSSEHGIRRPVVLNIPGRTFPVDIKYLPDCERFAGARSSESSKLLNNHSQNPDHNLNQANEGDDDKPVLSPRATQKIDNHFIRSLVSRIVMQQQESGELNPDKSSKEKFRATGAILVFLPGRAEIDVLAKCLQDDNGTSILRDNTICRVHKLHSSVPRSEQKAVFQPAEVGTVKIVIATNVAETSLTIPDVSHVVDTGRVKESRYNPKARIKELVTVWTSQASMKQRAGRAGRTSAGVCWRLVPKEFHNEHLISETAPEMVRTPLDELILQICLLYEQRKDEHDAKQTTKQETSANFPTGVRPIQFLSKTPTPPPTKSLIEACRHLLEVGALHVVGIDDSSVTGSDETSWIYRLTPLGYHISRLPVDAKVGKVLLVGCVLGCLDGALTVASALSCTKSCFFTMFGSNKNDPSLTNAFHNRDKLVEDGFGGRDWPGGTVKGDLIAVIAAYRAWKKQRGAQKWKFCKSHALDNLALEEMHQLRQQFLDSLKDAGFVSRGYNNDGSNGSTFDDCNVASEDALLTSCCLVAGLYPNICSLMRPQKGRKGGRLLTKEGDACRPSSNSFQMSRIKSASADGKDAYAVYHTKHKSVGTISNGPGGGPGQRPPEVFLSEVNFVSRFALLLFGGELEIVKNAIIVDGWLKFKVGQDSSSSSTSSSSSNATIENAILIQCLRNELDKVMSEHILENCVDDTSEKQRLLERHKKVLHVVRQILMEEG